MTLWTKVSLASSSVMTSTLRGLNLFTVLLFSRKKWLEDRATASMKSITMCCTLSLVIYISFRKQGCTRGTNNCEVLTGEEWRQPINKDTEQSAVDTLADDIPGFPACRPHPWHWTILYRVKLSLGKTKSRIMCLSPKITSQALRSSLRGKQQPLFTLWTGVGVGG